MEQMMWMNSRMDEIQDFVKTNVKPTTDKKGKQVTYTNQLPSQATANPRNQGASSSQTHNINHIHIDEEVVETALAISKHSLPMPNFSKVYALLIETLEGSNLVRRWVLS